MNLYIDANYGGSVWSLSNYQTCWDGQLQYGQPDFGANSPSSGYWNNRTSSYKSYYSCETSLYDNANYAGTSTGFAVNRASLGTMNDRANSAVLQYHY